MASAFPVNAADSPFVFTSPYRIVVPFETIELMPGPDSLGQACGATSVHGCTVFYGRRLDCGCFSDTDHWHLRARAQFIPRIVLSDATVLEHERMHIDEVRSSLEGNLTSLTAKEFHSATDCEAAAQVVSESFPSVMDTYQRDSNVRHHPMYVQGLEDAQHR